MRRWLVAGQTWMYGHLLIFAGITASGEGALLAIRATGSHPLAAGGRWALCAGLGAFLLALALIRAANAHRLRDPSAVARMLAAGTFVVLGSAGAGLSPAALVYAALALVLAVVAVETLIRRLRLRSASGNR